MAKLSPALILGAIAVLAVALPVGAQDSASSPVESTTAVMENNAKTPAKDLRKQIRDTVKEQREEVMTKIKSQREEFKEKLAGLKDARKQAAVSKLDAKLAAVNTRRVAHMEQVLTRLQAILDAIATKAATAKTGGANTQALDLAITNATAVLTTAREAVLAQKEQEYVISIVSETTLKQNVGTVVSNLQADLRQTHAAVVAAKQAVMQAALELAKIKVQLTPTGAVSPTVTGGAEE